MSQIHPVNFRDIGGIPVETGTLVAKKFFRSGQVVDVAAETVDFLHKSCKVKTIYDFRSKDELQKMPDTKIPEASFKHIDILKTASENQVSMDEMITENGDAHANMLVTYEEMVTTKSAQEGYTQFLVDLVNKNEPILFHCFAGKDRTGFAAALILKIAGATDQQIMTDYLRTNEMRQAANQEILNQFKDKLTAKGLEELEIALCVAPEYLVRANQTINKNYGNFTNYLKDGLQLGTDYVAEFRNLYVK